MLSFKPETGGMLLDDLELDLDAGYAGTSTVNLGSASSYSGTLSGGDSFGGSGPSGGGYTGGYTSSGASGGSSGGTSTGQDVANVLSSLFNAAGAIIPAVSGSSQAAARAEQAKLNQMLAGGGGMGMSQGAMGPPPASPGMSTGMKVGLGILGLGGLYWLTRDR